MPIQTIGTTLIIWRSASRPAVEVQMDNEKIREFSSRVGVKRAQRLERGVEAAGCAPTPPRSHETALIEDTAHWSTSGVIFWSGSKVCETLPPAVYQCEEDSRFGPVLVRSDISTDGLLQLPEEATIELLAEFDRFWASEQAFRDHGFLWKRGFLLWGPPGSGKTSALNMMMHKVITRDEQSGIVVIGDAPPKLVSNCLRMTRRLEPHRPIICVLEDLDAIIQRYSESDLLALLDGSAQIDNVVFVATTNYPELLDRRFVDRPSRIDTIVYVPMPSAAARWVYLECKEPGLSAHELEQWVKLSDGFSVAHLKEMIVAVKCLGQSLESVCARLRALQEVKPSSDKAPDKGAMGLIAHLRANGRNQEYVGGINRHIPFE
jgi:hypothetical protein